MKIATLNIDWAKKGKSKNHVLKIERFLNKQDFDFLIITEGIYLNLKNFSCKYFSEQIPENIIYEGLNYSEYLKGESAFRTIIYSKTKCIKNYKVKDTKTNLALEFKTAYGNIVIYTAIVGTWFKKLPYAEQELENCIADCENIYKSNPNLFIVGDLNTSFIKEEKHFCINDKTTTKLENLFDKLNLVNTTKKIIENIDHIIIPKKLESHLFKTEIFIEKDILSDHKGVFANLSFLR